MAAKPAAQHGQAAAQGNAIPSRLCQPEMREQLSPHLIHPLSPLTPAQHPPPAQQPFSEGATETLPSSACVCGCRSAGYPFPCPHPRFWQPQALTAARLSCKLRANLPPPWSIAHTQLPASIQGSAHGAWFWDKELSL